MKVISIANHKGGVGKSTSVACIGIALSMAGKKVLLIDLDAQQNLTYFFSKQELLEESVYDTLLRKEPLPVIGVDEGLDIVPASILLARADRDMNAIPLRELRLKKAIENLKGKYDYILLDCPPSLGIVTTNALVASTDVYIPLTAEALPLQGLSMLKDFIEETQEELNPSLKLSGIFVTRFGRKRINMDIYELLEENYPSILFETKIRENVSLAETPLLSGNVFKEFPNSSGAQDYKALTDEILRREKKSVNK